jgi:hypothetical protein
MLDTSPLSDVTLPPVLQPGLSPELGSRNSAQFYMLKDGKTGVLALGSFSDSSFSGLQNSLLQGTLSLKSKGATQLVVDVASAFVKCCYWFIHHSLLYRVTMVEDSSVPHM